MDVKTTQIFRIKQTGRFLNGGSSSIVVCRQNGTYRRSMAFILENKLKKFFNVNILSLVNSHKKGAYVDGHERDDVVTYRRKFLDEMKSLWETHLPPPPPSDERAATPPPNAATLKRLVLIYHNESIFNTNEGQMWGWATGEKPIIQSKTKGAGIMVSDFIE